MKHFILLIVAAFLIACTASETRDIDTSTPADLPVQTQIDGVLCGGMVAGDAQLCPGENEYCHREMKDMCGAADAPGICRTKPEMCTMDYNPVCGCDGQTYPNECAANSEGVSAAYAGDCK